MDFGIRGRRAVVAAASSGLGRACAEALAREGCEVTILARDATRLERAATELAVRRVETAMTTRRWSIF